MRVVNANANIVRTLAPPPPREHGKNGKTKLGDARPDVDDIIRSAVKGVEAGVRTIFEQHRKAMEEANVRLLQSAQRRSPEKEEEKPAHGSRHGEMLAKVQAAAETTDAKIDSLTADLSAMEEQIVAAVTKAVTDAIPERKKLNAEVKVTARDHSGRIEKLSIKEV